MLFLIKLYRLAKPVIAIFFTTIGLSSTSCRHSPSCSQYTLTSIQKYGTIKGTWLGMRRLLTCHSFTKSYLD